MPINLEKVDEKLPSKNPCKIEQLIYQHTISEVD